MLSRFAYNYVSKKSGDVPVESDDMKSCTVLLSNVDDIEPNPDIIALKSQNLKIQKSINCDYYNYIYLGGMRVS